MEKKPNDLQIDKLLQDVGSTLQRRSVELSESELRSKRDAAVRQAMMAAEVRESLLSRMLRELLARPRSLLQPGFAFAAAMVVALVIVKNQPSNLATSKVHQRPGIEASHSEKSVTRQNSAVGVDTSDGDDDVWDEGELDDSEELSLALDDIEIEAAEDLEFEDLENGAA